MKRRMESGIPANRRTFCPVHRTKSRFRESGKGQNLVMKSSKKEYAKLSESQRSRFKGVSVQKDKDGFYCTTHRARSKSYATLDAIPASVIKRIEETG